jgi:hypothetical protein
MRANGVPNFRDPATGSGGEGFPGGLVMDIGGNFTVDGVSLAGTALKHAEQVCRRYLPGGGGPPPQPSAAARRAALADAECMRTHGVPRFPDPTFGLHGGVSAQVRASPPALSSPAFRQAARACGLGSGGAIRIGD